MSLEPITERAHDAFAWIVHNWAYLVAVAAIVALFVVLS